MAEDADIIGAVVALLRADANVAGMTGARVYGGELPKGDAKHPPVASVVVQPSGGVSIASGSTVEHDTQRFDLFAYGATSAEADSLRRKCRRALTNCRRQVVAGVLIHWIEQAGGFESGRDRDTKAPVAFQSFQIYHALKEVQP